MAVYVYVRHANPVLDSSLVDSVLSDPFEYDYRFTKVVQATAVACTLQVLPIQLY